MSNPNTAQPLHPIDQAVLAADKILKYLGTATPDLQKMVAKTGVGTTSITDVPEQAMPVISIDRPSEHAKNTAWYKMAVLYDVQDGKASRYIIIPNDGSTPRIQSRDAGPSNIPGQEFLYTENSVDRIMTSKEQAELARDLSRIAGL